MKTRHSWLLLTAAAISAACSNPPPASDAGNDAAMEAAAQDAATDGTTTADAAMEASAPDAAMEASTPDASADAAEASADASSDSGVVGCPLTRVVVTTSDGTEGAYVTGSTATRTLSYLAPPMGSTVEQDHVVRRAGCRVYDLYRTFGMGSNQLVELDPANPYTPRRTINIPPAAMGSAPNPYDVVEVSPTKAYVVLYNSASLFVFNPQTGAMSGSVDLSMFAGSDGIPEATMIHVANGKAWVALQQLDRMNGYAPPARSTVVAIDTATDSLADLDGTTMGVQASISLSAGNPQSSTRSLDGRYWVIASTGTFTNSSDGALDVIDTQTGRLARSVTATALGGDPGALTMVDATHAWVATRVMGDGGSSTVVRNVDISNATVAATAAHTRGEPLGAMELGPDGNIWAINGSFGANGAVYFIGASGTEVGRFVLPARGDAGTTGTYSMAFAP